MSEFEKKHLEQKNWPLHANILFDVIGDKSHPHKSAAINRNKNKKIVVSSYKMLSNPT